ncbi:hypothetical protein D9M72_572100 [compost metagenome]
MGFLHRVGIDAGKCLRCHVDECSDVFSHEVRARVCVNCLQTFAQLRFGLCEILANLPQRLVFLACVAREADIGNERGQQLQPGRPEEIVAHPDRATAVAHDPGGNRSNILLLGSAIPADPVECIEPRLGCLRVECPNVPAGGFAMIDHHWRHFIGRVEDDERASPFERCRYRYRGRLEAA